MQGFRGSTLGCLTRVWRFDPELSLCADDRTVQLFNDIAITLLFDIRININRDESQQMEIFNKSIHEYPCDS